MELDEFVRTTLIEIMKGVKSAQQQWAEMVGGGVINPSFGKLSKLVQEVKFDVAVTVGSKTETGGGGGIKVWSIADASGKMNRSTENSTVSRIAFSVPILPAPINVTDVNSTG
jgi:hypothetical protein